MSATTESVHPHTLDQIQAQIEDWLAAWSGGTDLPIRFSRSRKHSGALRLVSHPAPEFKLEVAKQALILEIGKRRLSLLLDRFELRTGIEGTNVFLQITAAAAPEHPFLEAELRRFSGARHPAFTSRLLRLVKNLEEELPIGTIDEATAAPTDYLAILTALRGAPAFRESVRQDPLADAKLRGLRRKQQLLDACEGTFRSEDVAAFLGITRQAVDKRRASNRLLAITQGKRGYLYPAFQFEEGRTLGGLEEVLAALRQHDPWMQLAFFVQPNDRLAGEAPIRALRSGRREDVLRCARNYGEQGSV